MGWPIAPVSAARYAVKTEAGLLPCLCRLQFLQRTPGRILPLDAPVGAAAQHHGGGGAGGAEGVILRELVKPAKSACLISKLLLHRNLP